MVYLANPSSYQYFEDPEVFRLYYLLYCKVFQDIEYHHCEYQ